MQQQPMKLSHTDIRADEIARKSSLGKAIEFCIELSEFEADKQLQDALKVDKAQFSRWISGQEGIKWDKISDLMDICGNDAPLLWMLHDRGYDVNSLRRKETETEKENRLLRERIAKMEADHEEKMKEKEIEIRVQQKLLSLRAVA